VAVLDEDGALRETKKPTSRVLELGGADEHRAIDVMAFAGVGVDGRAAVHERVEERQRTVEAETLRADLEDQEWGVAGGLDVEGDELGVVKRGLRPHLGRVDRDLVPRDWLRGAARFQEQRLLPHEVRGYTVTSRGPLIGLHHRASARARRAHAISSPLSARRISAATA
jgi:hypothetical protein